MSSSWPKPASSSTGGSGIIYLAGTGITAFDPREVGVTRSAPRIVFTSLEKIAPRPVEWLWEKYIPAGCVTILEGDPGVGKTMVLADLAARVSRGFLAPDRNPAFDKPGFDPEPSPELVWWFAGQDAHGR